MTRADLLDNLCRYARLGMVEHAGRLLDAAIAEAVRAEREPMVCGHPRACLAGETTMHCRWCEELAHEKP